jgi:CHC2 zinc finger
VIHAGRPDEVREIRRLLANPRDICSRLGIDDGAKPQAHGLLIRCPWHADRTPSCSVREGVDKTIAVKCFGCGATGDVLDLVAVSNGMDARRNFPEVLRLASDLTGGSLRERQAPRSQPKPRPEPEFPPGDEVAALWGTCRAVGDDTEVSAWLGSRALDVGAIEDFTLARALPSGIKLPSWAWFQGRSWNDLGYRCMLPMFDQQGALRSVRARRIGKGDGPKTLPPAGFRMRGLVMADALGRQLLMEGKRPDFWPRKDALRIVVAEGEPDFLTWATKFSDADLTAPAVLGVVAGSWSDEIAARVPDGSRAIVRTHHDEPGEKYARAIFTTFANRDVTFVRGAILDCVSCVAWLRGAA